MADFTSAAAETAAKIDDFVEHTEQSRSHLATAQNQLADATAQ